MSQTLSKIRLTLTCWGASFSETSHSISVSFGNRSWLKWPRRQRAIFSAETVDSFNNGKQGDGVDAISPVVAAGEGGVDVKSARRLLESRRWFTAIGALGRGAVEADVFSLFNPILWREANFEWTRFKRASFRDRRLSFSIAEQNDVKDIP